ncbi:MAG: FkbM family methyltransferase [Pseudomonadota bacterium]
MSDEPHIPGEFIEQVRKSAPAVLYKLEKLLHETPEGPLRGRVRSEIWDIRKALGGYTEYFSQAGQDAFLENDIFTGMRNGVFVEIGAFDGIRGSNTLFFEKFRDWSGLLIEASPLYFSWLEQNRPHCARERVAVAAEHGTSEFIEITEGAYMMSGVLETLAPEHREAMKAGLYGKSHFIEVETQPLADILRRHELDAIDFLSIDIEGGEFVALEHFPFDEFEIDVLAIEYYNDNENIDHDPTTELMRRNNYHLVGHFGADQIWVSGTA